MVKPDFSRDYYADLELPTTADADAVKKQFRKLALKYHPDRNPGRESEVNSKFQIIQAAQEILTNAEQKARYDAHRARMRYTAGSASGVVGNPWQDVSSQFPPPPRRSQHMHRKPTGAERYASFAKDVPPTSPRTAKTNPSSFYKAWTEMKPKPQAKTSPTADPKSPGKDTSGRKAPRPASTPRTASQRMRAEASFARKSGFAPNSPMGDEPPVTSKNYASTRSRRYFPTETSPNRDRPRSSSDAESMNLGADAFLDPRQSTPYQTHGGEKLNPFDGVPLGRAKSARVPRWASPADQEDLSSAGQRQRSASVPDNSPQEEKSNAQAGSDSRSRERPRPNQHGVNGAGPFTVPNSSSSSLESEHASMNDSQSTNTKDKPSVFSFPLDDDTFTSNKHRFSRNSTDNINTRIPRQPSVIDLTEDDESSDRDKKAGGFNAEEWSQKIGPQIFEPQRPQRASASPTRSGRTTAKKVRPVRVNTGSEASGEQKDDSSGLEEESRAASATPGLGSTGTPQPGIGRTESPLAMDIDPPSDQGSSNAKATTARNIPVEPSRPEWRAGDVNGTASETAPAAAGSEAGAASKGRPSPTTGGSEDSEEFRTSFADFRKVEPFAPTGLGSFGDLRSNLPFESKASARAPIKRAKRRSLKLELPEPPKAPNPPVALAVPGLKPGESAWQTYVNSFRLYMHVWHNYNTRFVEHFQAREVELQRVKAANDFAWLDARDDSGVNEYLTWCEQDRFVREKWVLACDEHEKRVREFSAYRDRMMK
ncbi:DnaJ domain-containing protein [Pleurostoma richardsiae]|uniref:DnaJ domain-containing protein n=1 Tax=Pleurostoma richardsiae TaxID=41990 RepID=A0AA38RXS8_9PEZI|nr:DnaJ domain-containing protein [Pleurostoma richardsiae]